jgi:type IV pilus assembly protein PilC
MIDAGLPLVQCLSVLASQQENKAFQAILATVKDSVEQGATLSTAMRQHPRAFNTLYYNMIEAGELGGILDIILQRLAIFIEKNVKLKRAVQSASIYPCAVLGVAALIIILLLWKVIPIFVTLFKGLGAALPLPTRIVIGLSGFVGSWYGLSGLVAIIGSTVGLIWWHKTPKGRHVMDSIVLRLPVVGMVIRKIAVARFTQTLGTLITSGVSILDALTITARTSGNAIIEDAIMAIRTAIESGRSLVDPLKESGVFPGMVTQMIAVGEQTGALDVMLQKIASFYEDEVDAAVKDLLTALEPVLIVVLGLAVGGIVISMYMPLFSLIGQLAGHA